MKRLRGAHRIVFAFSISAMLALASIMAVPWAHAEGEARLADLVSGLIGQVLQGDFSDPATSPTPTHGPVKEFGANVLVSGVIAGQSSGTRRQDETTIAINPKSPSNLVIGSHDLTLAPRLNECAFYTSFDGGTTFPVSGYVPLVRPTDFCSDSALAGDDLGNFYFAYLSVRVESVAVLSTSDITVAKSIDGGCSFGPAVVVFQGTPFLTFPDKEYTAVDFWSTSPFKGNVYVTWTLFDTIGELVTGCQILFSRSVDGGRTWASALPISPKFRCRVGGGTGNNVVQGSSPFVGPEGTVYVVYYDSGEDGWGPGQGGVGKFRAMMARSRDGGITFTAPAVIAEANELTFRDRPGGFRWWASMFPVGAAGPNGDLAVVFASNPDGADRADILGVFSLDGGLTWRGSLRVNDDMTANDQFFPWLAVKPNDGTFHAIFGDRRADPNNKLYDVFYAGSTGRGNGFRANIRVTDAQSDPGGRGFIGDYFGLSASGVAVHPVWTDARRGQLDVFTARGAPPSG